MSPSLVLIVAMPFLCGSDYQRINRQQDEHLRDAEQRAAEQEQNNDGVDPDIAPDAAAMRCGRLVHLVHPFLSALAPRYLYTLHNVPAEHLVPSCINGDARRFRAERLGRILPVPSGIHLPHVQCSEGQVGDCFHQ